MYERRAGVEPLTEQIARTAWNATWAPANGARCRIVSRVVASIAREIAATPPGSEKPPHPDRSPGLERLALLCSPFSDCDNVLEGMGGATLSDVECCRGGSALHPPYFPAIHAGSLGAADRRSLP